jgi:hypothetical protein
MSPSNKTSNNREGAVLYVRFLSIKPGKVSTPEVTARHGGTWPNSIVKESSSSPALYARTLGASMRRARSRRTIPWFAADSNPTSWPRGPLP